MDANLIGFIAVSTVSTIGAGLSLWLWLDPASFAAAQGANARWRLFHGRHLHRRGLR